MILIDGPGFWYPVFKNAVAQFAVGVDEGSPYAEVPLNRGISYGWVPILLRRRTVPPYIQRYVISLFLISKNSTDPNHKPEMALAITPFAVSDLSLK